MAQQPNDIVGINDLSDPKTLAYLAKYDSTQGRFPGSIEAGEASLIVNGKKIPVHRAQSRRFALG